MKSHTHDDYVCPICLGIEGIENNKTLILQPDIVYKDDFVAVIINSFARDGAIGNAIVVPTKHFENLYDLAPEYGHHIFDMAQKVAIAMEEAYECDGITTMQCNEPAGGQHAFHYHFHVAQRYDNDTYFETMAIKDIADPQQRAECAQKLRAQLI